jgi:hypothetical protein
MNNNFNYHRFGKAFLALGFGLVLSFPSLVQAQVKGLWDTTALTKIDVTAINAPKLVPEHNASITDGSYLFKANGGFVAGEIKGTWKAAKNQYNVNVDVPFLENSFRAKLEKTPGIVVNDVVLQKRIFKGIELDSGNWGDEYYDYKLDNTKNGRREVVKETITVRVAGFLRPTKQGRIAEGKLSQKPPVGSAFDAAVLAFNRYWLKLEKAAD